MAGDAPRVPGFLGRVLTEDGRPVGMCFQVAEGVLVTARHVLEDIGVAVNGAGVGVDPLAGGDRFEGRVAITDSDHDLAVIRTDAGLPVCVAGFAATNTVPSETRVNVVGVSEIRDANRTYRFVEASGEWRGTTVRYQDDEDVEGVTLGRFHSQDVMPGMSGAPVCQGSDGLVVGVVCERYNSDDGWLGNSVWAARTEDLAALLSQIEPVALSDVSEPAVRWRSWRAAYRERMSVLARDTPDALLVGGSGPPLASAHVLREVTKRGADREDGARQREERRAPERLPAARVPAASEDCWLLGGPGAGKSRLMRSWTAALANRVDAAIPVPIRASDLARAIGSPSGPADPLDAVARAVDAGLRSVGRDAPPWLAQFLTCAPDDVQWLILVDGIDEVPDARTRRRVFAVVDAVRARLKRCRIIVGGRPLSDAEMDAVGWLGVRYELLPLEEQAWDTLVVEWFTDLGIADPEQAAANFAAELGRQGMLGLARIPLMSVILGQLFALHPGMTLPSSRVEAYERIVEEMHGRRVGDERTPAASWVDPRLPAALSELRKELGGADGLLSLLAYERAWRRRAAAVDWVVDRTSVLREKTSLTLDQWRVEVREELRNSGLVVADGDDFDFVHATLAEFFAARHAARDRVWSRILLIDHFGYRARELPERVTGDLKWLRHRLDTDKEAPFNEWIYAFWHEWHPFTRILLRLLRRGSDGWAFVAFLAWRRVRLNPRVVAAARRTFGAVLAQPVVPTGTAELHDKVAAAEAAALLAMTGDPAGADALVRAAADPDLGVRRLDVAKTVIALGDPRGLSLLADVTEEIATAPNWDRETGYPVHVRREAIVNLAQRGHPAAMTLLRLFLQDEHVGANDRGFTYELLADAGPNGADIFAELITDIEVSDERESGSITDAVKHVLYRDDAANADRLAEVSAARVVGDYQRLLAARRLVELGDPRAADRFADLARGAEDKLRLDAAWELAELGDQRAVARLVSLADPQDEVHGAVPWYFHAKALATEGKPGCRDVLAAVAADPALPMAHRCAIVTWLALSGDSRGVELALAAGKDPRVSTGYLYGLADAIATRGDERFTTLLASWVERSKAHSSEAKAREKTRWAERVLAVPRAVLGDGLYAAEAAATDVDLNSRWFALTSLLELDHPALMDRLVALYHDLIADEGRDRSTNSDLLIWAVDLLARNNNPLAVPHLVARFRNSGAWNDSLVGSLVEPLRLLIAIDGPAAADALVELGPDIAADYLRKDVLRRLEQDNDPRRGEILANWMLDDRPLSDSWDWKVIELVQMRHPRAVEALAAAMEYGLAHENHLNIRWAIKNLIDLGSTEAVDLIAAWAADSRLGAEDRIDALFTLTRLRDPRASDLIDRVATDLHYGRRARRHLIAELAPRTELDELRHRYR